MPRKTATAKKSSKARLSAIARAGRAPVKRVKTKSSSRSSVAAIGARGRRASVGRKASARKAA